MAGYKVEICGVNTAKLPLLKEDEKEMLMKRIKSHDLRARERFINGNLRLVLSVIQRFSGTNENVNDLFQVGCIGLIKAIDNFDLTQGVRFSTYAVPMIVGEIRRFLRDNSAIRVSRSLRDTAYKAIYAREALITRNNREPTVMEIAEETGIPKEDIVFALDAIVDPVSLYEPVYRKNGENSWVEYLALNDAMKRLSHRENRIIKMRFYEGKTQMEVADELAISQAQISRIEKSALQNMRTYLRV